jgi:predicted lactoylglutathione lyase
MSTAPRHSQAEPPTLGEHGGFPVYAMPAFVSLAVSDLPATVRFFIEALDFDVMFSGPELNGVPMLVHLRRARYQDILVRQASPGTDVVAGTSPVSTFAAADAAAIDELQARVERAGGAVVGPAADTPWNTHELTVADPDGHRFTFTARAESYEPRDFDATMREVADRLGS